jgi:prepilin peptidase CpaA
VGAVAGGVLALAAAARRGQLVQTVRGMSGLFAFWASGGLRPSPVINLTNPATLKIPYAIPVAAGLLVVVLGRWS